jgi:hypothetical protein
MLFQKSTLHMKFYPDYWLQVQVALYVYNKKDFKTACSSCLSIH